MKRPAAAIGEPEKPNGKRPRRLSAKTPGKPKLPDAPDVKPKPPHIEIIGKLLAKVTPYEQALLRDNLRALKRVPVISQCSGSNITTYMLQYLCKFLGVGEVEDMFTCETVSGLAAWNPCNQPPLLHAKSHCGERVVAGAVRISSTAAAQWSSKSSVAQFPSISLQGPRGAEA